MPAQLSPDTQALLDKAFADRATATQADSDVSAAHADVVQTQALLATKQQAETDKTSAALTAHQAATASAHDFIVAAAAELGYTLPG